MHVFDDDGRLVSQGLKHGQVTLIKLVQFVTFNIQHADYGRLCLDGHRQFGFCFAWFREVEIARILADIGNQKRLALCCHPACDPISPQHQKRGLESSILKHRSGARPHDQFFAL